MNFAPDYDREGDLLLLPRDIQWRKELYGDEVMEHPAKMQLHIVKLMVETYAQPGWRILDPFGGTGTTALAATMGYQTTLIELEDMYYDILREVKSKWLEEGRIKTAFDFLIKQGDCRIVLRDMAENSFDMVITSPPYAVNAQVGEVTDNGDGTVTSKDGVVFTGIVAKRRLQMYKYGSKGADSRNIGRLNPFQFNQAHRDVLQKCLRVVKPGGFYVSVTKDNMKEGQRVELHKDVIRDAEKVGWKVYQHWKWKTPGSMFQNVQRSKGEEVLEDEDVIVFQKPS